MKAFHHHQSCKQRLTQHMFPAGNSHSLMQLIDTRLSKCQTIIEYGSIDVDCTILHWITIVRNSINTMNKERIPKDLNAIKMRFIFNRKKREKKNPKWDFLKTQMIKSNRKDWSYDWIRQFIAIKRWMNRSSSYITFLLYQCT